MPGFVHLRVNTEYSVSNSVVRIPQLVEELGGKGFDAVAVNDANNLFASLKFSKDAIAASVKPILGADIKVDMGNEREEQPGWLTLLCLNREGYENLCWVVSEMYKRRAQSRYKIDDLAPFAMLAKRSAGLIALSGGQRGLLGSSLAKGREDLALRHLGRLRECFQDRLYLSIERLFGSDAESYHIEFCLAEGKRLGIATLATNNVQFLRREDYDTHKVRVAIHKNLNVKDPDLDIYSEEQYLKSPEEMQELFSDLPEAVANSAELARRCNFFILSPGKSHMPKLATPDGLSPEEHMARSAKQSLEGMIGADKAMAKRKQDYRQRLETEIDIIVRMGFAGYYLIVAEFVRWARENGVAVGPGRGSGPGSLVAYALGITRIDPIRYDLLFERFLNPERISLPDFDIDFDDRRRDDVIAHVAELYGEGKVSQIITFGTFGARASIRDVGRVLGKPFGQVDRIAKLVPFDPEMTLDKAMEAKEFADECQNPESAEIIDRARAVEGLVRNPGRHAGGVVIAPEALTSYCSMYCDEQGSTITQFDKDDLEAVGLVKYDFLGLRALSTIRDALENAQTLTKEPIDIDRIDLNDPKTLDLINQRRTLGVFQLESPGMRDLISNLKPDSFNDIIALVALFRPGPMGGRVHEIYCERKKGEGGEISYYHHSLKPVLEPTHGVFIYQEQVMQAAQIMAGYTLGKADILRKGMSKQDTEALEGQRPIFLKGCSENNISKPVAEQVFDLMVKFAGYGFNKSHSVSYGLLAFQTAWLKSHHPAAYMAALMSNEPDNDTIARMIRDCASMGIKICQPDINASRLQFTVVDGASLRYGLGSIKGVGSGSNFGAKLSRDIAEERESQGRFRSLEDFLSRIPLELFSNRTLISLIGAGAFDSMAEAGEALRQRLVLIDAAERDIIQFVRSDREAKARGQSGLFAEEDGVDGFDYHKPARDDRRALAMEYETLCYYFSTHPLSLVRASSPDLDGLPHLADLREGSGRHWALLEIRDISTARGGDRLMLSCDDEKDNQILSLDHARGHASVSRPWSCKRRIALAKVEVKRSRINILGLWREDDMRAHLCRRQEFRLRLDGDKSGLAVLKSLRGALAEADAGKTTIVIHCHLGAAYKSVFEIERTVRLDADLYRALCEHPACTPGQARYDLRHD